MWRLYPTRITTSFPVTSINARDICAHSFDIPMGKCNRKIVMSCESSLSHDALRLCGCEFNIDLKTFKASLYS